MLGWQLQAILLKTARQTSQGSTADLPTQHGDMSYQIRKGMSLMTAQAVLR